MALLYGGAGRLTAKNGGFRPGQEQCKYAFDGLDPSDAAAGVGPTPFNAKFGGATMTPTDGSARPSRIFFTDYSDDPWAANL